MNYVIKNGFDTVKDTINAEKQIETLLLKLFDKEEVSLN